MPSLANRKTLHYDARMSTKDQLLEEIERFLAISGMTPTAFGDKAAGERGLLRRLKAGGDVTLGTADRIKRFMRDWRPGPPKQRASLQPAA